MIRRLEYIAGTILWLGLCGNPAFGQAPPPTILTIDIANVVEYRDDISDPSPSKFATNPDITPSAATRNFTVIVGFGDIVAVNGQPAKGVYVFRPVGIGLTPTPAPGQAIADTTHASLRSHTLEILIENTRDVMDEVFWARIYAGFHCYRSMEVGREPGTTIARDLLRNHFGLQQSGLESSVATKGGAR